MSLLLEALKKAERAKEDAQRRARGEGEPAEAERKPVLTRDNLPDISPTLEIASEDLAAPARDFDLAPPPPAREPKAEVSEAPRKAPPPRPAPEAAAPARPAADEQATRAAAKKVFEAKFREPNPKMPFYITMGALGVFAVGTVVYFWVQLRPPPALVNLNPPRQAEAPVAGADTKPIAAAPAAVAAPVPETAIAGLPPTAPARATPAPAAQPKPQAYAPAASAAAPDVNAPPPPRQAASRSAPPPASAPREAERTASVRSAPPQVHPKVEAGYGAYLAGDLATARGEYQQALRDEPGNRDALLGLAATEVRGGRYETAEALYLRALQSDPRDSQAQAALVALRSARADPLVTESRVKSLLAADPGAHALNFALGNQLAQQNRWAEAQQEYFKAYAAEPDNADFAYNLAVSLDHLRQPKQALEYYQRAIALAERRAASFDVKAARARAEQLAR